MPEVLNAWGEPVAPEDPDEIGWVPPEERSEVDSHPADNAMTDLVTGERDDDLNGWIVGDPVE